MSSETQITNIVSDILVSMHCLNAIPRDFRILRSSLHALLFPMIISDDVVVKINKDYDLVS